MVGENVSLKEKKKKKKNERGCKEGEKEREDGTLAGEGC